ncbi:transposable element Tcb2 transposase [Trichonephila clavipes]|nr:transposable element Tcb2 transposase [Trichonephila clavipes]
MANNQSVRRHLNASTRGRIIGKLEEGRSVTSGAAEFGIAHSIVSRLWRQFQTTGTAIRGFSSGRPRGTTPSTLSYRPEETGGRQREKSLDTRHRRLDDRYRVLPWPEDCTVAVCLHDALYDESRFSLSSDYHRILIWRERGSRNHPSNIIERDRYGGHGVLVWGGIMLGSRTDLLIFEAGSVNGTRYCNEILLPYVRYFRGAMGLQFLFMDDNAPCHRTVTAEQLLESEDIERMDWPARSPDLNPIEHVWDFLGRRLAARTLPPVTIRELRLTLQDEWEAMPQQLIDTLILSMGRRCETCCQGRSYPLLKTGCFLLDTHHRDVLAFSRIALHATFSIKLLFIPLISLLVFQGNINTFQKVELRKESSKYKKKFFISSMYVMQGRGPLLNLFIDYLEISSSQQTYLSSQRHTMGEQESFSETTSFKIYKGIGFLKGINNWEHKELGAGKSQTFLLVISNFISMYLDRERNRLEVHGVLLPKLQ